MKKFFLVVFSLFILLPPCLVKADTLPNFDLDVAQYDYMDSLYYSDMTMKDVIDYWVSLESDYYNSVIFTNVTNPGDINDIYIYLVPKSVTSLNIDIRSLSGANELNVYFYANTNWKDYKQIDFFKNTSVSIDLTNKSYYEDCYLRNNCRSGYYSTGSRNFYFYRSDSAYSSSNTYNNQLYTYAYLLYSDIPINYVLGTNYTSKFSGFTINGQDYEGVLPTYFDIYPPQISIDYQPVIFDEDYLIDLGTFHIGGLNVNEFSNFTLSSSFVPVMTNYSDYDLSTLVYKYGRISESGYYRYELINDCTSTSSFTSNSSSVTFNFSNSNCTSDLSSYDKFYITLWNYDPTNTLDLSLIGNPVTNYSGGYLYRGVSFDFNLYELLNPLPNNFTYLISSNAGSSRVYVSSPNTSVVTGLYDLNNIKFESNYGSFGSSFYNSYLIGTINQKGLYVTSNTSQNNIELSLFVDVNTIISYDYHDNYVYYDNSGTITSISSATIDDDFSIIINPDTNSYNVDYYFHKVNDFMFSLSNDINTFSSLTQDFYNTSPLFMRTFIYVVFILLCSYFVYLMIRK